MKTNFVIFSQSRSGSTLLKELLDSHPSISCEGEIMALTDGYIKNSIFLRIVRRFPLPFMYYQKTLSEKDIYGFTLFSYHIRNIKWYLPLLNRLGWKIIYLERKNIIDQSLSGIIAANMNKFHNRDGSESPVTGLKISEEEFLSTAKRRIQRHMLENEILKKCEYLPIYYEDDLENSDCWAKTTAKIFNYLNVEYSEVRSNLNKTYSKTYSQLVGNYDELNRTFQTLLKDKTVTKN